MRALSYAGGTGYYDVGSPARHVAIENFEGNLCIGLQRREIHTGASGKGV